MLVVFSPIFVADTKIILRYDFVAPLRATTLKIIWLFLPLEVLCKDFVDINYENASFGIPEESI